jgi:integrase
METIPAALLAILTFLCGAGLIRIPEFPQQPQLICDAATPALSANVRNYEHLTIGLRICLDATSFGVHVGGSPEIQHTLGHVDCPVCAQETFEAMSPEALAIQPFPIAAKRWLWDHSQYIEPRTIKDYRQYIKSLDKFFHDLRLNQITIGHIRVYQRSRAAKAGAGRVNMEISTLQQILKNSNLWHEIAPLYKPLPTKREGAGRPYSAEEKALLLKTAFSKKCWYLAAHSLRIMLNTGCGFGELRATRRADIDSIKTAFRSIRTKCGLKGRIYDCRVTAITETLSDGDVSINTAQKLYGHVDKAMQKRYYKPDLETLRAATDKLQAKKPPENVQKIKTTLWGWTSGTST